MLIFYRVGPQYLQGIHSRNHHHPTDTEIAQIVKTGEAFQVQGGACDIHAHQKTSGMGLEGASSYVWEIL